MAKHWTPEEIDTLSDAEILELLAATLSNHEGDYDFGMVNFGEEDVALIWDLIAANQRREESRLTCA